MVEYNNNNTCSPSFSLPLPSRPNSPEPIWDGNGAFAFATLKNQSHRIVLGDLVTALLRVALGAVGLVENPPLHSFSCAGYPLLLAVLWVSSVVCLSLGALQYAAEYDGRLYDAPFSEQQALIEMLTQKVAAAGRMALWATMASAESSMACNFDGGSDGFILVEKSVELNERT